jgi:chemotaxis protein methyltransferase CheR
MTSLPFVGSSFVEAEFSKVCELLLAKRGFDLSMYKDQCVKRRIASRIRARGFQQADPYLELLARDETEVDALLAAISIHVSQFFRNPAVFALLEKQVLPEMIQTVRQSSDRQLKVWSVGCASGEEPYSLALLLHELKPDDLRVSIVGTDISPPILQQARGACFDALRLSEVPRRVLDAYFVQEAGHFRLLEPIRSMVTFSRNNILADEEYPPADLILCRNVLIYFSREEQDRILLRFARMLPAWGRLVLGRSENMLGEARGRYVSSYPAERIYQLR